MQTGAAGQAAGDSFVRQPLAPLHSDFRMSWHDGAALDRLVEAAFEILRRVGARYESPRSLAILAEHGADVDRNAQRAWLPTELVRGALAGAPRSFLLAARDPACDIDLASGLSYCGPDGCGTEVVDEATGHPRPSTKDDLAVATRLHDYLGSIGFWWPTVGAGDRGQTASLHELDVGLRTTVKHLQPMVNGERHARYAIEMARAVAGGAAELRRRPLVSNLTTVVTPLVNDREGSEAALIFAEAGVPVCVAATPTLGTTAPATRAGAYALALADLVSAIVPLQLAFPGVPVIGSITQLYADPRSAAVVTMPLDARGLTLGTELLHHVGLPSLGAYGGTDAPLADSWQAGVEKLQSLMLAPLDGCELFVGIGLTDSYRRFSPEALLLDDDLYHRARHAFLDIDIDDDTLAIDVIEAVGPGGHFLAQKHTRRHLRAAMTASLTQQPDPEGGYRAPRAAARERAAAILERYRPEPLDAPLLGELDGLLAAADDELLA